MKEGLKDFGFFLLLEALFTGIFALGKDDLFKGFEEVLGYLGENIPMLANLNLPVDIVTWIIALLLLPLTSAIPYHFRLVREVNKYKGEGLVQEVTKQPSEFRGELKALRESVDDVMYEQNNIRQMISLLRKTYPQLDKIFKESESKRKEEAG